MYIEGGAYFGLIISCGALFLSILKTSILLHFVESSNSRNWIILRLFVILFLIGYILTLGIIGNRQITIVEVFTVVIFLFVSFFVLLSVNSSFQDILLINSSRSLLKERNNDLQKLNTQLDSFLYSTAHDLRSPLASILGLVDLGSRIDDSNEKNIYLNMIQGRVDLMDALLKDIIKFSKNKHLEIKLKQVDLSKVIQEVTNELKVIKKETTTIEINIEFENLIWIDEERIKAVLYNLISNSICFQKTDDLGWIKIYCKKNNDQFEISVLDNGIGIDIELIDKIFDMFFKGSHQSRGSGLGLYITKEIVDALGGKIEIESMPGRGTLANVTFPYPLSPFKKKQAQKS